MFTKRTVSIVKKRTVSVGVSLYIRNGGDDDDVRERVEVIISDHVEGDNTKCVTACSVYYSALSTWLPSMGDELTVIFDVYAIIEKCLNEHHRRLQQKQWRQQ